MLDFIKPPHPSEFAVLRLVAEAQEGGGDVFDIGRLCRTLEPGDMAGWETGWLGLAEATEAKARRELAAGHKRTAMQFSFTPINTTACPTCFWPAMNWNVFSVNWRKESCHV
jgi:hypothetical protein